MIITNVPHALSRTGRLMVRAEAPAATIAALTTAFEDFKTRHEARYSAIEAHLDDEAKRGVVRRLNGSDGSFADVAIDMEYTSDFKSYFRKGAAEAEAAIRTANGQGERAAIQASMSVGDNSAGGYLAPVEWDRTIAKAQRARSPFRRIARVVQSGVGAYSTVWSNDQWGSGWVGETAARAATTNPTLAQIVFPHGEIYANPAITQRLLDDSAVNLEEWLGGELADTFDRQEGIAFISGDGTNKPFGLLQYVTGGAAETRHPGGVLATVASGHATTIPSGDVLIDFKYGLLAPYRQNATWLMNSQTAAAISKFKDSTGAYVWREGLMLDQPDTLLGRPVAIDENMPNIGANALPIAFGDFQAGYVINDRLGVRILRDPFTNKPYVSFYATKRVGGGVADPNAIRLLKVAAS